MIDKILHKSHDILCNILKHNDMTAFPVAVVNFILHEIKNHLSIKPSIYQFN